MKKILRVSVLFFGLALFTQCQEDLVVSEMMDIEPIETAMDTIENTNPTGEENYLSLDSDYIFDQEKLPTFELTIPESNLNVINNDPAAEQYVEASLTYEGETIHPVGVRYKGSIGAYVNCLSGGSWSNPSGFKTCTKLSMKVKINWDGREDHFYGLKKLQFHSMNLDPSQMRDRLGYWLFAEMGVPTPRAVHARLLINGEFAGLFILVEQIDGRFSRHHFDDEDGNVYKEIWPLNDQGKVQSDFLYRDALKTNEDENPSLGIIKGLAIDLDQATNDNDLKLAIANWMDVEKTIAYAMVDRTIKHDDGPFHWYCGGGGCAPHNFYLIEEPNNQKINIIPWDLDNAFENITNNNPVTNIFDEWGETSNNCAPFTSGFLGLQQKSAACDNLVYGMSLYSEEFESLKQDFIDGPFSEASINDKLDSWADQIREATLQAATEHPDGISIASWQSAMDELKQQCQKARN